MGKARAAAVPSYGENFWLMSEKLTNGLDLLFRGKANQLVMFSRELNA